MLLCKTFREELVSITEHWTGPVLGTIYLYL